MVYQDHEDEKNSSEFFEAEAEAPKSVLIELILPNTQEKMGAGITLYPKKITGFLETANDLTH